MFCAVQCSVPEHSKLPSPHGPGAPPHEWTEGRRYLGFDVISRSLRVTLPGTIRQARKTSSILTGGHFPGPEGGLQRRAHLAHRRTAGLWLVRSRAPTGRAWGTPTDTGAEGLGPPTRSWPAWTRRAMRRVRSGAGDPDTPSRSRTSASARGTRSPWAARAASRWSELTMGGVVGLRARRPLRRRSTRRRPPAPPSWYRRGRQTRLVPPLGGRPRVR